MSASRPGTVDPAACIKLAATALKATHLHGSMPSIAAQLTAAAEMAEEVATARYILGASPNETLRQVVQRVEAHYAERAEVNRAEQVRELAAAQEEIERLQGALSAVTHLRNEREVAWTALHELGRRTGQQIAALELGNAELRRTGEEWRSSSKALEAELNSALAEVERLRRSSTAPLKIENREQNSEDASPTNTLRVTIDVTQDPERPQTWVSRCLELGIVSAAESPEFAVEAIAEAVRMSLQYEAKRSGVDTLTAFANVARGLP